MFDGHERIGQVNTRKPHPESLNIAQKPLGLRTIDVPFLIDRQCIPEALVKRASLLSCVTLVVISLK